MDFLYTRMGALVRKRKTQEVIRPQCLFIRLNRGGQWWKSNQSICRDYRKINYFNKVCSYGFPPPQLPLSGDHGVSSSWYREGTFNLGILSPAFRKKKRSSVCPLCILLSFKKSVCQSGTFFSGISWLPSTEILHITDPEGKSSSSGWKPTTRKLQIKITEWSNHKDKFPISDTTDAGDIIHHKGIKAKAPMYKEENKMKKQRTNKMTLLTPFGHQNVNLHEMHFSIESLLDSVLWMMWCFPHLSATLEVVFHQDAGESSDWNTRLRYLTEMEVRKDNFLKKKLWLSYRYKNEHVLKIIVISLLISRTSQVLKPFLKKRKEKHF